MSTTRRALIGAAITLPLGRLHAQANLPIRIGVLGDQSGPYQDISGPTAIACVQQALAEFSLVMPAGMSARIVTGDHQNKADVGASIARQWFDEGVDMITDVPNSAVALAVSSLARERNRVFVNSTAATADLTGSACTPNTIHWTYDTGMLANVMCQAVTHGPEDSWFFITADYAYGHAMQRDAQRIIAEAGGRFVGSVTYPFPGTTDFSSFLLSAQASGARYIGLANAGADTINSIKQAGEFGIGKAAGPRVVAMQAFLPDIKALGLALSQGLLLTETFYWDLNDRTRAFTKRVLTRSHGEVPCMSQAGAYSGTLHYLKAVRALGPARANDGAAVVAQMKAMPADDDAFGPGSVRADGLGQHPAYLFQVKSPAESRSDWDCYTLRDTIPAERAFKTLADAGCSLAR